MLAAAGRGKEATRSERHTDALQTQGARTQPKQANSLAGDPTAAGGGGAHQTVLVLVHALTLGASETEEGKGTAGQVHLGLLSA